MESSNDVMSIRVIWDTNTDDGFFARCTLRSGDERDVILPGYVDADDDGDVFDEVDLDYLLGNITADCEVIR